MVVPRNIISATSTLTVVTHFRNYAIDARIIANIVGVVVAVVSDAIVGILQGWLSYRKIQKINVNLSIRLLGLSHVELYMVGLNIGEPIRSRDDYAAGHRSSKPILPTIYSSTWMHSSNHKRRAEHAPSQVVAHAAHSEGRSRAAAAQRSGHTLLVQQIVRLRRPTVPAVSAFRWWWWWSRGSAAGIPCTTYAQSTRRMRRDFADHWNARKGPTNAL